MMRTMLLFDMKEVLTMTKNIYLFVSPSGAGKTTITERLEEKYGLKSIQSYTTRKPRYNGEKGHTFISDEEFDKLENIVAYTNFCNNRYAATAEQIDTHDLYTIDPKGVDYFREHYKGNKGVKVIYINSPLTTRYERMKARAESGGMSSLDATGEALKRIANDAHEFYEYIHNQAYVDYVVYNTENVSIDELVDGVYSYICSCERGD